MMNDNGLPLLEIFHVVLKATRFLAKYMKIAFFPVTVTTLSSQHCLEA